MFALLIAMTIARPAILALSAACGVAIGASALASAPGAFDPNDTPAVAPTAERLVARTPVGRRAFLVADPDAMVSAAALLPPVVDDEAPAQPGAEQGHRLYAKVVIRLDDPAHAARVDAIAKGMGLNAVAERFADRPGPIGQYWTVQTLSVRSAIALADALALDPLIPEALLDTRRPRALRTLPSDPGVAQQWYLSNGSNPAADLNVLPAWKAGFIGTGVTVGIIESGFNPDHPDLVNNFNAAASQPPPWIPGYLNHGTSCAGLVAMAANNGLGGAGVAYGAKVSRQYYGSDTETAQALLFAENLNHIRSNSWGPPDSAMLGPIAPVEAAALESGVISGRNGKGTIFVWAGGNGGQINDRVDYDQYASHRSAMAIGSIDNQDQLAAYSEVGSSLMFVTTSSTDFAGSGGSGIYTATGASTTPPGDYTPSFGGTSAAAPIASGVVALVLQARPELSWRDVHHVLVRSARKVDPTDEGWTLNAGGRWVNERYGFGALDAGAAVALAQTFPLKGPEIALTSQEKTVSLPIPDNDINGVSSTIRIPSNFLVEKAQVVLTAPHGRLGDLRIELVSPGGTGSVLAQTRSDSSSGYSNYTFTTVRAWDERARGEWKITISDRAPNLTGTFSRWTLKLFGGQPACPGDWNVDGAVNLDDIFIFLNNWFANDADADNNGSVTLDDVFIFINRWFASAGCVP